VARSTSSGQQRPCESAGIQRRTLRTICGQMIYSELCGRPTCHLAWKNAVELRGFEPLTPSMRTRCATGLRHSPNGRTTLPPCSPDTGHPRSLLASAHGSSTRSDERECDACSAGRGNSVISGMTRRAVSCRRRLAMESVQSRQSRRRTSRSPGYSPELLRVAGRRSRRLVCSD
jgi:hypothetical protein